MTIALLVLINRTQDQSLLTGDRQAEIFGTISSSFVDDLDYKLAVLCILRELTV